MGRPPQRERVSRPLTRPGSPGTIRGHDPFERSLHAQHRRPHPSPASHRRLRAQTGVPHRRRLVRRRLGTHRAVQARPQPHHRGRPDRGWQHRTVEESPRTGRGQRPHRNRAQRSDHPPCLLRRLAPHNVGHHRREEHLRAADPITDPNGNNLAQIHENRKETTVSTEQTTSQVAVITGASSGIGAATARALAGHGYSLALLARRVDRIEALAAELGDIAIAADVTDRDSLVTAANQVQAELGGADILVNNAGVMLLAPFSSEQRHELRQMVEVNLLGAMTATEVFLDQLRNGGGDLINISSVAGRTARAGNSGYAATKWGLNGWSEALRQELQPDIRVTVIEPGAVATEITDHITDPAARQGGEQLYAQLAITADDVADVIAFAVTRPRRMTLNEILLRPTAQTG